jgi:hypothetical protein
MEAPRENIFLLVKGRGWLPISLGKYFSYTISGGVRSDISLIAIPAPEGPAKNFLTCPKRNIF